MSQSRFFRFLQLHPTSIKSCQLYLQNIFWMYPLLSIWCKQLLFLYCDNLTAFILALLKSILHTVAWKIILKIQTRSHCSLAKLPYLSEFLVIGPLGITQISGTFLAPQCSPSLSSPSDFFLPQTPMLDAISESYVVLFFLKASPRPLNGQFFPVSFSFICIICYGFYYPKSEQLLANLFS